MTMNCPVCTSARVDDNTLPLPVEEIMQGAQAFRARGNSIAAIGMMAGLGISQIVAALRPAHQCQHCGHKF